MKQAAFNYSVNIVSLVKNNQKYGACIAWAMQVDYDKVLILMGKQSVTGKMIEKKDVIGLSVLGKKQIELADHFGISHSDEVDKFKDVDYYLNGPAIYIKDASRNLKIEVIDKLHLPLIESDNLIYGKIIEDEVNNDDFLTYLDYKNRRA